MPIAQPKEDTVEYIEENGETIAVIGEMSAERKAEVHREWLVNQAAGFQYCAHKAHRAMIAMEELMRASDDQLERAMEDIRSLRKRIHELELERDSLIYRHEWPLPSNRDPTSTCSLCGEMYEISKGKPCPTVLVRHRLDEDWAEWAAEEDTRASREARRKDKGHGETSR